MSKKVFYKSKTNRNWNITLVLQKHFELPGGSRSKKTVFCWYYELEDLLDVVRVLERDVLDQARELLNSVAAGVGTQRCHLEPLKEGSVSRVIRFLQLLLFSWRWSIWEHGDDFIRRVQPRVHDLPLGRKGSPKKGTDIFKLDLESYWTMIFFYLSAAQWSLSDELTAVLLRRRSPTDCCLTRREGLLPQLTSITVCLSLHI